MHTGPVRRILERARGLRTAKRGSRWNGEIGEVAMKLPESVKPAAWGVLGGALAAIVIGFGFGGWVTGKGAAEMVVREAERTEEAVVEALTPRCVARAEREPEQLQLMRQENMWQRDDFIIEAGWVDNVSEDYRTPVARRCAEVLIKGMRAD